MIAPGPWPVCHLRPDRKFYSLIPTIRMSPEAGPNGASKSEFRELPFISGDATGYALRIDPLPLASLLSHSESVRYCLEARSSVPCR